MTKPRGRPRNASNKNIAEADRVLARSAYTLACWGFALRSRGLRAGVFEAVGRQALNILGRKDHDGRALGPDRVEQIFEAWFEAEQAERRSHRLWALTKRWGHTKESLQYRCPNKLKTVEELAAELLRNGGKWPGPPCLPIGDLLLTEKAYTQLGPTPQFRMLSAEEISENGVEK